MISTVLYGEDFAEKKEIIPLLQARVFCFPQAYKNYCGQVDIVPCLSKQLLHQIVSSLNCLLVSVMHFFI